MNCCGCKCLYRNIFRDNASVMPLLSQKRQCSSNFSTLIIYNVGCVKVNDVYGYIYGESYHVLYNELHQLPKQQKKNLYVSDNSMDQYQQLCRLASSRACKHSHSSSLQGIKYSRSIILILPDRSTGNSFREKFSFWSIIMDVKGLCTQPYRSRSSKVVV